MVFRYFLLEFYNIIFSFIWKCICKHIFVKVLISLLHLDSEKNLSIMIRVFICLKHDLGFLDRVFLLQLSKKDWSLHAEEIISFWGF